eukprot:Hpha_TRINITY_DN2253_c0_g1::TRINITY_DN2253_c0_g1_i1::g.25516::m.25516
MGSAGGDMRKTKQKARTEVHPNGPAAKRRRLARTLGVGRKEKSPPREATPEKQVGQGRAKQQPIDPAQACAPQASADPAGPGKADKVCSEEGRSGGKKKRGVQHEEKHEESVGVASAAVAGCLVTCLAAPPPPPTPQASPVTPKAEATAAVAVVSMGVTVSNEHRPEASAAAAVAVVSVGGAVSSEHRPVVAPEDGTLAKAEPAAAKGG